MAETAITPAPLTGMLLNSGAGNPSTGPSASDMNAFRTSAVTRATLSAGLNPSDLNSFRIAAVIDRLSLHVQGKCENDTVEFLNLCLSLSRGIDFALTNHEVPSRSRDLPSLIKQVFKNKHDTVLQAAIMVLMISVKSACQCGWFSAEDSQELSNLAKEVASSFCSVSNFNTEPSCSPLIISTIMSRFYPRMKMGHTLTFVEVKPGYNAYVRDFRISKDIKSSPGDKIRLLVVQTDSIETSSCLVSPAKVNFLLNGKGIERRTYSFMDTGPQMPTVVTPLLKYGSNLLQAVGEFDGNYIIAVSFMSEIPNPDSSVLQDYEQHTPTTMDSDSELIVGSSRISLNCPISFTRIKTPVKGHSCKHIQCFDFDNYVDINSRRPSWRCPHCNQHVCFADIRVDKRMVKVLEEVGSNVSNIIVSSDWSWNAADQSDDAVKKPEDKTSSTGHDKSTEPADVMDLTQTDDQMDAVPTCENEDIKHVHDAHHNQLPTQATALSPHIANTNGSNQSIAPLSNEFWTEIYRSTLGPSQNVRPNTQIVPSSILTDPSITPSRELDGFQGNNTLDTDSVQPNGISFPNTSQLQQYHQFGNPPLTNEYGRFISPPNHITRTPTAVQALPAQTPTSAVQRNYVYGSNAITPNSLIAQTSPAAPTLSTTPRANPHQVSPFSSSSLLQHPGIQQNTPQPSGQLPQPNPGFQNPNQAPNAYRVPSSAQQMATNLRMPRATGESPGLTQPPIQSSGSFVGLQSQMRPPQDPTVHRPGPGSSQPHLIVAANRAAQMVYDSPRTIPSYSRNQIPSSVGDQRNNSGVSTSQLVTSSDASGQAELSWRPAGRMRGALSGQAYADALNQFIIRPNQQAQAARPVPNVPSIAAQFRPPGTQ